GRLNTQSLFKLADRFIPVVSFGEEISEVVVGVHEKRIALQCFQEVLLSRCNLALTLQSKAEVIVCFSVLRIYLQHLAVLYRSLLNLAQDLASPTKVVARQHET